METISLEMKIKERFQLKNLTTLRIGGSAKYLIVVVSENDLVAAMKFAKTKRLPWQVVGEGSNLVVADKGYGGVIIQNQIKKLERRQRGEMIIGSGNNLLKTVNLLNRLGLSGMEKMAGIPGTVGGAIYGCAGAYGQEIKDHLVKVRIFDGKGFRELTRKQCRFGYRTSIFKKHKNWIILEGVFDFDRAKPQDLVAQGRQIIKLRLKKYPKGLKCPGSFFKNIKLAELEDLVFRRKFLQKLPKDQIMYGKVPTGYLLEQVQAKGMRQGRIQVAEHHANLIYNPGGGKASDVKKLADKLRTLVKKKFGITIEEEVQYL